MRQTEMILMEKCHDSRSDAFPFGGHFRLFTTYGLVTTYGPANDLSSNCFMRTFRPTLTRPECRN